MKTCTTCNVAHPLSEFPKKRGQCRTCRNEWQKANLEARRLRDKQRVLEELAAKDAAYLAARNIAAPRTYNVMTTVYVPEKGHCRNDGNKHIQSRGV